MGPVALIALMVYLGVALLALYWIVRLGVRHGLADHAKRSTSRSHEGARIPRE